MKCLTIMSSAPSQAKTGLKPYERPANAAKVDKGVYRTRFIATHFATRSEYQEYRQELLRKLDAMKLDEIVRIPKSIAPSYSWVLQRAKLNNYIVTVRNVDDNQVWIRLK